MSSTPTSKSSTPGASSKTGASVKSVKIKLKVSPEILAKFPPHKQSTKSSEAASSSPIIAALDQPTPLAEVPVIHEDVKAEGEPEKTEEKSTAPVKAGLKRDSTAAGLGSITTSTPKPRSRPGPKRRKPDTDESMPWTVTMTGPGAHRLGPKANQGAINANLRALDRKNVNPCRKWGKRTLNLKTFNGSEWILDRWTAPPKPEKKANGEDNATTTPSTNSDTPHQPSSNVPSVTSHQPEESKDVVTNGTSTTVAASPAIVAASA